LTAPVTPGTSCIYFSKYRAELSARALKQMHGFPVQASDRLIAAMTEVIDYPDDPLRTSPTSDPYVRRVEFGDAGLITYPASSTILTPLVK
jgi:hypothetical protein